MICLVNDLFVFDGNYSVMWKFVGFIHMQKMSKVQSAARET